MKCQYCGSNLSLEDEHCPYCGRENTQAAKHQQAMKNYESDYEKTKNEVIRKSYKFNTRAAKAAIIALLLAVIAIMLVLIKYYSDFDSRYEKSTIEKRERVTRNYNDFRANVESMEKKREYLAMENYMLTGGLRGAEGFNDYERVFTAVISYRCVYSDILDLVTGFDSYGTKSKKDLCNDIAVYISEWKDFVDGGFWNDLPDSEMHKGEHGAFLSDVKKETEDMVAVYFKLSDAQAGSIWKMQETELGDMLYSKCQDIYPEETVQ